MGEFQSCLGPLRSSTPNLSLLQSSPGVWGTSMVLAETYYPKSPAVSSHANPLCQLTHETGLANKATRVAWIRFCASVKIVPTILGAYGNLFISSHLFPSKAGLVTCHLHLQGAQGHVEEWLLLGSVLLRDHFTLLRQWFSALVPH